MLNVTQVLGINVDPTSTRLIQKQHARRVKEHENTIGDNFEHMFGAVMDNMTPGGIIGKFKNNTAQTNRFLQNIGVNMSADRALMLKPHVVRI